MPILAGPPQAPVTTIPASSDDPGVPSNTDPFGGAPEPEPEYTMPEEPSTYPPNLQALLEAPDGEHHRTAGDGTVFTAVEPAAVEAGEEFRADPPKEVVQTGGVQP